MFHDFFSGFSSVMLSFRCFFFPSFPLATKNYTLETLRMEHILPWRFGNQVSFFHQVMFSIKFPTPLQGTVHTWGPHLGTTYTENHPAAKEGNEPPKTPASVWVSKISAPKRSKCFWWVFSGLMDGVDGQLAPLMNFHLKQPLVSRGICCLLFVSPGG